MRALRDRLRERASLTLDAHTGINIVGLAVAFCAALFIALIIRVETTYDRFLPGHERIFLVAGVSRPAGQAPRIQGTLQPRVAEWIRLDLPGVEAVGRMVTAQHGVRRGEVEINQRVLWADPDVLRVMPFPGVAGDVGTALDVPDGVVLTRSKARQLFGRDDPIGELLELDRRHAMRVTAVIEDLPEASSLDIEMLASGRAAFSRLSELDATPGPVLALVAITYLRLSPGASVESVMQALPPMMSRHAGTQGRPPDELTLVPIADIHLHPQMNGGMKPPGSRSLLGALASIGLLIVVTAGFNYVNLVTARGAQRAVEVGVRKSFGARRRELVLQFMGESVAYVAIAAVLAVLLVALLRPHLDALLPAEIPANLWRDEALVAGFVGATLLIGVLASIYPAFVLSSYRPAVVLRGGPVAHASSGVVRQVLIAVQLSVLIGLLIGTTYLHRQGQYAVYEALDVEDDVILVIQTPPIGRPCNQALRDEIRALPRVRAAACSLIAPNANSIAMPVSMPHEREILLWQAHIDFEFFPIYGIEAVAGRLFDPARAAADSAPTDAVATREAPLVLNEAAVRRLGFTSNEDAVGEVIQWSRLVTVEGRFGGFRPAEIIGVVPDFPMGNVRSAVEPTVFFVDPGLAGLIHVKLDGREGMEQTLAQIDALWRRLGDGRPISRRFYDEILQRRYESLIRQARVFAAFSTVALFVACLGLFGLSAFATERRTREVGIRKALGARRPDIARHFLWEFTVPVLVAAAVALPVAYIFTRRWLDGFAYRVDMEAWTFIAAAVATWLIAIVTVLLHVMRAARARAVEALRYE